MKSIKPEVGTLKRMQWINPGNNGLKKGTINSNVRNEEEDMTTGVANIKKAGGSLGIRWSKLCSQYKLLSAAARSLLERDPACCNSNPHAAAKARHSQSTLQR